MVDDLEKLSQLLEQNHRIMSITVHVEKKFEKQVETVTVKLEKNGTSLELSSNENDFCTYVSHLHKIPHIEDEDSDFVYIDDPNHYFEVQNKILDLLSEDKKFTICERNLESEESTRIIRKKEKNWILAEKNIRLIPVKLSQIFYDVGVINSNDMVNQFTIVSK